MWAYLAASILKYSSSSSGQWRLLLNINVPYSSRLLKPVFSALYHPLNCAVVCPYVGLFLMVAITVIYLFIYRLIVKYVQWRLITPFLTLSRNDISNISTSIERPVTRRLFAFCLVCAIVSKPYVASGKTRLLYTFSFRLIGVVLTHKAYYNFPKSPCLVFLACFMTLPK